jgi:hypothetical protein
MSNYNNNNNNQNRFKFNVRPQNQQQQTGGQFQAPQPPPPPRNQPQQQQFNSNNRFNNNNYQQQQQERYQNQTKPNSNQKYEEIVIEDNDDDDDDLLDISDNELIRASQVVESQLKFTNNVHQTTSNAMNIFSQMSNSQQQHQLYNNKNDLMGPPTQLPPGTMYSNSQMFNNNQHDMDDFKLEINRLKTENMQKDGEVKILRDKLKRLENETNKMRTERIDLIKKLQQQQEESNRILQKQIEKKEAENQIKTNDLHELSSRYKILEAAVKKNPNMVVVSSSSSSNNNITSSNFKMGQNLPQKRNAPLPNSPPDDNDENDHQPEVKRPTLNSNRGGSAIPNHVLQNRTNIMNSAPTSNTNNNMRNTKSNEQLPTTHHNHTPVHAKFDLRSIKEACNVSYKRSTTLNTRFCSFYSGITENSNRNLDVTIFNLTDYLTDVTNFLEQFSLQNFHQNQFKILTLNQTMPKYYLLEEKLSKTNDYLRKLKIDKLLAKIGGIGGAISGGIQSKIEHVLKNLNKELKNLLLNHFIMQKCDQQQQQQFVVSNLFTLLLNQQNLNNTLRQKKFQFFIDLVCKIFQLQFKLYIFQIEANSCSAVSNHTNSTNSTDSSNNFSKEESLTKDFFNIVFQMLKFINCTKLFDDNLNHKKMLVSREQQQQSNSTNLGSISGCLSYMILKVLNNILDCFNAMSSKQCLNQILKPYDKNSCLYSSLLDNLHNIYSNKYVWYQFAKSNLN